MRPYRVALFVVLAVLVLPMLFVTGIYATHPRSEDKFFAVVDSSKYGDEWTAFVETRSNTFFLHEGERACAWLREQPFGLMRGGRQYRVSAMMDRYLALTDSSPQDWEVDGNEVIAARRLVAMSGWQYLCKGTLIIHSPHYPFGAPDEE